MFLYNSIICSFSLKFQNGFSIQRINILLEYDVSIRYCKLEISAQTLNAKFSIYYVYLILQYYALGHYMKIEFESVISVYYFNTLLIGEWGERPL